MFVVVGQHWIRRPSHFAAALGYVVPQRRVVPNGGGRAPATHDAPLLHALPMHRTTLAVFRCSHFHRRFGRTRLFQTDTLKEDVEEDVLEEEEEATIAITGDDDVVVRGIPYDFVIVETHTAPASFDWSAIIGVDGLDESRIARLALAPHNVSLPVALMIVDPITYPSLSRARKVCRKGSIVIERSPARDENSKPSRFVGRVGDRVFPKDLICRQQRMAPEHEIYEAALQSQGKPPFELPVVYEDHHLAIVNKPAGVAVHRQGHGTSGMLTVRGVLPFVLQPPRNGTMNAMKRPVAVHRLDKPTSGVLVVAKTRTAMVELARQFRTRIIKKTYMAIVQGIPTEKFEDSVPSSVAAERWDVDTADHDDSIRWNVIDTEIDGKSTVTVWRAVKYVKSLHAGYLTLVERKPKTGRFHQLRRHMAWICDTPIIGDTRYDKGTDVSLKFRNNGLFLCSTKVVLDHPFYNTPEAGERKSTTATHDRESSPLVMSADGTNTVQVSVTIPLPAKFHSFLEREEERYHKLSNESS
jgi:23S rRNA-/tRNA-specific pseudouridylate synthase